MTVDKKYHVPRNFPICDCGVPAKWHYVDHAFRGYEANGAMVPCYCGLSKTNHRTGPSRKGRPSCKEAPSQVLHDRRATPDRRRPNRKLPDKERGKKYIGIDGEGVDGEPNVSDGTGRPIHNYVMLAASYEDGSDSWVVEPEPGKHKLTTVQCLDMILELPTRRTRIFAYSFNYDLTMMLADLDNESLYMLFRPERRQRAKCESLKGPYPVYWGEYILNLQGTKFSVRKGKKRVVIWDLFKFFQGKFVQALRDWKIGDEELWTRMQLMKEQRHLFAKLSRNEVLDYCLEETRCMGQLARKLIESHTAAGLTLKAYYGAGSSGGAMLDSMNIKEKLAKTPPAMAEAVASAFFGGRFENSVIGDIRDPLTNWDISSAYPYQLAFLPCLEHASWHHTTRREDIEKAECQNGALVRYTLGPSKQTTGWGPFPYRIGEGDEKGSIAFPIESGGGWIWLDEYIQGEKLWPHVEFREAWVHSSNCDCKPFAKIPEFYNLRLQLGKEGPGLVIKLGVNSCYGKLAQSVGNAMYSSWIWAGMITSGCRAQLLQLIGLHKDRANVLMLATDGLLTREKIIPPAPLFTGTAATGKPLGGWEEKKAPNGMFIARPGIYFPLNPTDKDLAAVRARGVGRAIILQNWQLIVDVWKREGINGVAVVANVNRFCGAKTSISESEKGYKRANHKGGIKPSYGQWIGREVGMSFDPLPKREKMHGDGLRLILRRFSKDVPSAPYDRATMMHSKEAMELREAGQEMLEQPEHDFTYDLNIGLE